MFSFKEDIYNFIYYDYEDITSYLGGIAAFMHIIIDVSTAFIIVYFILSMSKVIMEKYEAAHKTDDIFKALNYFEHIKNVSHKQVKERILSKLRENEK